MANGGVEIGEGPKDAKIQKVFDEKLNGASPGFPLLRVKKLSEKAVLPSRASPLSAGYDLSR